MKQQRVTPGGLGSGVWVRGSGFGVLGSGALGCLGLWSVVWVRGARVLRSRVWVRGAGFGGQGGYLRFEY